MPATIDMHKNNFHFVCSNLFGSLKFRMRSADNFRWLSISRNRRCLPAAPFTRRLVYLSLHLPAAQFGCRSVYLPLQLPLCLPAASFASSFASSFTSCRSVGAPTRSNFSGHARRNFKLCDCPLRMKLVERHQSVQSVQTLDSKGAKSSNKKLWKRIMVKGTLQTGGHFWELESSY